MFDTANLNEDHTPIERRHHRRQRTFLHGKLLFLQESVSQDCTIRNLSDTGARLEISEPVFFTADGLMVVTKSGAAHEIGLIWRRGRTAGVSFSATYDLHDGAPPRLAYAHRLWIEHRPR